jgi:hypothetical protein
VLLPKSCSTSLASPVARHQRMAQCAQPLFQVTAIAPLMPVRPLQDQPG